MEIVLVGAGIMSATLGTLLTRLQPDWHVTVVERLGDGGRESSHAWHNAGTGHAGLCEFNYTPRDPSGAVDASGAIRVGERFATSLRLWAHLVEQDLLPPDFLEPVPHMGFGRGADGVAYLRARHEALRDHPLFAGLEYSDDRSVLAEWLPLMFAHRDRREPVAVTRAPQGTDVDFGLLTRHLLAAMARRGATVRTDTEVRALHRAGDRWQVRLDDGTTLPARFVFVGAGGATLPLLRSAGLPEVRGLGGFPISGQFLRTSRPDLVAAHHAKLYGHAEPGEPTLSVPHLDRRVVAGREYLMFGPFAAFSPRFLTHGRPLDLARSLGRDNVATLLAAARDNRPTVSYLVRQLAQTRSGRLAALRRFVPSARAEDWELVTAGQRVQVLRRTAGRGTITGFGTEVVVAGDRTLAGLLGASPGASSAAADMVDVLATCFPDRMPGWAPHLHQTMPLPRARAVLGLP
jgi:malate dehydrogenase (quinone)